jgi:hypothetical protein
MMGDRAMAQAIAMDVTIAMDLAVARKSLLDDISVAIGDINRERADIAVVAVEAAPALNPAKAAATLRLYRRSDGEDADDQSQKDGKGDSEGS